MLFAVAQLFYKETPNPTPIGNMPANPPEYQNFAQRFSELHRTPRARHLLVTKVRSN